MYIIFELHVTEHILYHANVISFTCWPDELRPKESEPDLETWVNYIFHQLQVFIASQLLKGNKQTEKKHNKQPNQFYN